MPEPVNEDDFATQRFASLRSTKFLTALVKTEARIAARLSGTVDWHNALRALRDPAAHRLPLTIIRAVLNGNELRERERLQSAAKEAFTARDYVKGLALNSEADNLGKFLPLLESPGARVHTAVHLAESLDSRSTRTTWI